MYLFVAIASARRGCGKLRGVNFDKLRVNNNTAVSIVDGHQGTNSDESSRLASMIETLVRTSAPFGTLAWAKVPNSINDYIRERILVCIYLFNVTSH